MKKQRTTNAIEILRRELGPKNYASIVEYGRKVNARNDLEEVLRMALRGKRGWKTRARYVLRTIKRV